ncbi:DUF1641 domain-containing protein [Sulfobacillus thermosulfidooxidans]|nr:DUF1641 domain-containing protein [Sulfobacillus thermosulfidooxidans]OLZ09219.1 hypothetical protein BFX05_14540 [Sulfobacillus thermosulfidooxidans]OLZ17784.1 hypothetical protein BFX06_12525 [Sulfobacillus thermosulfidooxidans]OLZ22330.1 hypothetical protein BFX07_09480 [Sulfobacillus thermosulfidooxidans]
MPNTELQRPESVLTEAQWQGLAQLGDLVTVLTKLLEGPMGSVITGYAAEASSFLPAEALPTLKELLELLAEMRAQGVFNQLATVVGLASETLTRENLNAFFQTVLDMAGEASFAEVLRNAFQEAAKESAQDMQHLGGLAGLMRVMKDKDVQAGLRMMGIMAGKMAPLLRSRAST